MLLYRVGCVSIGQRRSRTHGDAYADGDCHTGHRHSDFERHAHLVIYPLVYRDNNSNSDVDADDDVYVVRAAYADGDSHPRAQCYADGSSPNRYSHAGSAERYPGTNGH